MLFHWHTDFSSVGGPASEGHFPSNSSVPPLCSFMQSPSPVIFLWRLVHVTNSKRACNHQQLAIYIDHHPTIVLQPTVVLSGSGSFSCTVDWLQNLLAVLSPENDEGIGVGLPLHLCFLRSNSDKANYDGNLHSHWRSGSAWSRHDWFRKV